VFKNINGEDAINGIILEGKLENVPIDGHWMAFALCKNVCAVEFVVDADVFSIRMAAVKQVMAVPAADLHHDPLLHIP
jgi:hypothetical protein